MIVACVRTGTKYGSYYVYRLKKAVERHLQRPHRFVCLTDSPKDIRDLETVEIHDLPGWWGKMKLFEPTWRDGQRVLYFDLDTVPCGDLSPLADLDVPFGICDNFARLAGGDWPCAYNSSVMTLSPQLGADVWRKFLSDSTAMMARAGKYGDQKIIEELIPDATLLQYVLPPGFFVGYRDLPKHAAQPDGCSVVVFAGSRKPHNTDCQWAQREWLNVA